MIRDEPREPSLTSGGASEDIAPAAPDPAVLVEAQQGGVHPHTAAPLVHPAHIDLSQEKPTSL